MDLKPAFLFSRRSQSHGYGNLVLGSNNQHHHLPGRELAKVEMGWPRWTHRLLCMTSLAYCTICRSSKCLCFLLLLSAMLLPMVPIFPSLTKAMTLEYREVFQGAAPFYLEVFKICPEQEDPTWRLVLLWAGGWSGAFLHPLNFSMSMSVKLNTLVSKGIHFL